MTCSRIENGWKVLFTRTTDLVQNLQIARRDLTREAALARLDRIDQLILDDLAYVTKDQAETRVLFELIGTRYERRSILITAPTAEPGSGANQMRQRPNSREHFS